MAPEFLGNSYMAVVYGQPTLSYMDGPFLHTGVYTSRFLFVNRNTTGYTSSWPLPELAGKTGPWNEDVLEWWPITGMDQPDSRCPKNRPLLDHKTCRMAFMNQDEVLDFAGGVLGGTPGNGFFRWGFYALTEPELPPFWMGELSQAITSGVLAAQLFTIPRTGWYAVKLEEVKLDTGVFGSVMLNLQWRSALNKPFWRMAAEASAGKALYGVNCRRTAASLLVSNRTNLLKAQGDVLAARTDMLFPGMDGWKNLQTTLENAPMKFTGNARNGCYTYMEFDSADEIFRDYVDPHGFPLVQLTDTMMNVITIQNSAVSSTEINNFAVIYDSVLEFKSQTQLFPIAVSSLDPIELINARRINNMTTYFYENDVHWDQIKDYISKMWKWTRSHSAAIGGALSLLAPEMAPVIRPIAMALQT